MKIIDLLNKIANGEEVPKKIKYKNKIYEWKEYDVCYGKIMTKKSWVKEFGYVAEENRTYFYLKHCYQDLNDEVEILEEENELHANSVEFNVSYDKRDCVITLDENDLGIDKLHLDNCYFYKENGKWYVKKYDFKTIKLEEEKKIPKKIEYYDDSIAWVIDNVGQLSDVDKVIIDKLNEVIDYLKSKGE